MTKKKFEIRKTLPTVDIKGKPYVEVKNRLGYLSQYEENNYSIVTEPTFYQDIKMWMVRATLTIGDKQFTGHSQAIIGDGYINKTSALENAETSAVGRACAMAGIGVIDSVASADEVNKAKGSSQRPIKKVENPKPNANKPRPYIQPNSREWNNALDALADGRATISDVDAVYQFVEGDRESLLTQAANH